MKLWEREIDRRLREDIRTSENQVDFMSGRSTMEAIYLTQKFTELYRDRKKDPYMVFIDLEKGYNEVPSEVVWRCSEKKSVSIAYIRVIRDMC